MAKSEEMEISIKSNEDTINSSNNKNKFSLLLPYYTTDKWTQKLKQKIKTLAAAYKDFYKKVENENNNPFYKTNYNKYKFEDYLRVGKKYFQDQNYTTTGFTNYKTNTNIMNTNENNNYYKKKILNEILPPVTNYNPNEENIIEDGFNYFNINDKGIPYLSPKSYNLFCISAQQRNQHANMNKYYSNKKKKDEYYYGNHKKLNSTNNLFSNKAQYDDFNKFINEFQSKNRINFFKKNDYNPQLKSAQPKNRKQISALKDLRKKQYLDYIKTKSEDNYMKFYYNQ